MGMNSDMVRAAIAAEAQDMAAEAAFLSGEQKIAEQEIAMQVETANNLQNAFQETVNPGVTRFQNNQKDLKDTGVRITKARQDRVERRFIPPEQVKEQADQFERRNPELKSAVLRQLLDELKECKSKDELLDLLQKYYPDPTLADQALDFLLATTLGDLQKIVKEAKEQHTKLYKREIDSGKNIDHEVKQYAALGLTNHKSLRDLYRDITGNPRDPIPLFLELSKRFAYKDLRKIMAFLFHSLGADLKSQGPSIPAGQLHRLLTEIRNLQAGLGAMKFFQGRMRLINVLFQKEGISLPPGLNFEEIARTFVNYLQERYPNSEKALQLANKMGLSQSILGKIIVLSQMRDGVREMSLDRFFRSIDHRNEVFNSILEALESLEDELDELLEEDREKEDEDEDLTRDKKNKQNSIDSDEVS